LSRNSLHKLSREFALEEQGISGNFLTRAVYSGFATLLLPGCGGSILHLSRRLLPTLKSGTHKAFGFGDWRDSSGARGRLLADRGSRRLAANHTLQSHGTHQPRHCASRHVVALPPQFAAQTLRTPIRPEVVAEDPFGPKPCHAALARTVLPLQLLHPFPLTRRRTGAKFPDRMRPVSTRLRRVFAMQPIFAAIDPIAAHSEAYSTPDA
jgi:hypothetical protein